MTQHAYQIQLSEIRSNTVPTRYQIEMWLDAECMTIWTDHPLREMLEMEILQGDTFRLENGWTYIKVLTSEEKFRFVEESLRTFKEES